MATTFGKGNVVCNKIIREEKFCGDNRAYN